MKQITRTRTRYAFNGEHLIRNVDTFENNEWVREDIEMSTPAEELLIVPDAIEPYARGVYG